MEIASKNTYLEIEDQTLKLLVFVSISSQKTFCFLASNPYKYPSASNIYSDLSFSCHVYKISTLKQYRQENVGYLSISFNVLVIMEPNTYPVVFSKIRKVLPHKVKWKGECIGCNASSA